MARRGFSPPLQGRGALAVLFLVAVFNYIDRSLISVLQVPIKQELGLSDGQLGALTGLAFALLYAFAAIPLGRLVDRWRRTWLLAAAIAVWSIMTALSGLATGFFMLLLLRMGVAVGEAAGTPATHSLLSDYFALRHRGRAFSVWALAPPLGLMFGLFASGWLAADLGWRESFLFVGLTGLLIAPLLLLLREPPRGQFDQATPAAATRLSWQASLKVLWRLRSLRYLVVAGTLHNFTLQALVNWIPPFYSRVHGVPLASVGLWAALMIGLGGGVGAVLGGVLIDRLARRDVRWYGWAPGVACLLLVPLGLAQLFLSSTTLSLVFGVGTIACAMFYVVPVNVASLAMVSPFMRGFTSAALLLVGTILGMGMGPFLIGLLSDALTEKLGLVETSLRYAMGISLLGSFLAGLLFLRMGREVARDIPANVRAEP